MHTKDVVKNVRNLLKPLLDGVEIPVFPDAVSNVESLIESAPHIDSDEAQL
ncbi:hypothetical protein KKF59_02615 [Patescibacteria group bacterium]|nr:hypothetical protein [Patescibacteria group bacterium]MBU1908002.1 hypothetical protein [Patescibacteria group bacterium]